MSNSWEINIAKMLKKQRVAGAAIIGLSDGKVYGAQNVTFTTHEVETLDETEKKISNTVDELATLKAHVKDKTVTNVWMSGEKFILVTNDDDTKTSYFKTKKGGAAIIVTEKLILVGIWLTANKQCGGNCNEDMDVFAKEFMKVGY